MLRKLVATIAAALALAMPAAARADLVVFAAASLKESLTEAAGAWAAAGHAAPVLSFGASSALARQIEHGAPAAIFVSADERWMDYLEDRSLVVPGTRAAFLGNELVLVTPASNPLRIEIAPGFDLAGALAGGKLAMADPDAVPAGRYGRSALTSLGVWETAQASVVRQADVRSALALVERGEARVGVVYRTDALVSTKVTIAGAFPGGSHEPIVYPLAIVAGNDSPQAHELRTFLLSAAARNIFVRHGFQVR